MAFKLIISIFACIFLIQSVSGQINNSFADGFGPNGNRSLSGFGFGNGFGSETAREFVNRPGRQASSENQRNSVFDRFGSEIARQFLNRARRQALQSTFEDQRNSVRDSANAFGNLARSAIEARTNLTKTKYDLALTGPKIVRNFINNSE